MIWVVQEWIYHEIKEAKPYKLAYGMIVLLSYGLKPSGLYRHQIGLGLHRVGYNGRRSSYHIAKLAFHAKESPIRHGTKSSILYLHSPGVRPKVIV